MCQNTDVIKAVPVWIWRAGTVGSFANFSFFFPPLPSPHKEKSQKAQQLTQP